MSARTFDRVCFVAQSILVLPCGLSMVMARTAFERVWAACGVAACLMVIVHAWPWSKRNRTQKESP